MRWIVRGASQTGSNAIDRELIDERRRLDGPVPEDPIRCIVEGRGNRG